MDTEHLIRTEELTLFCCSPTEDSHTRGCSDEKRGKMLLGQQTLGRHYHRQPFPFQSHGPDVCCPQTTTTGHIWLARINGKISFPQLPCVLCSLVPHGSWCPSWTSQKATFLLFFLSRVHTQRRALIHNPKIKSPQKETFPPSEKTERHQSKLCSGDGQSFYQTPWKHFCGRD